MKLEVENQIIATLDKWGQEKVELPKPLRLYHQLLHIQSAARPRINPPVLQLSKETVYDRLRSGRTLLRFSDISIDWPLFQDLVRQTCEILLSYSDFKDDIPQSIKEPGTLKIMTEAWYQGKSTYINENRAGIQGLIIHTALKPFLNASGEALFKHVNQEIWLRGYCPICGDNPDFSFLDKERGARHLVCSRCDAEWLFTRMECPYCGNQDQDTLAYFTTLKDLYRLYVCDNCKGYIKTIDLRCTESTVLIPLEKYLTINLDEQALCNGYSQPAIKVLSSC